MYKILQLSDLHWRVSYPEINDPCFEILRQLPPLWQRLALCRDDLAESGDLPDLVLLTGDITDYGNADDFSLVRKQIREAFPDAALIAFPGNHDKKEDYQNGWLGSFSNRKSLDSLYVLDKIRIVVLDNVKTNDSNGCVAEDQCLWLSECLNSVDRVPCFLAMHHHMLPFQHNMPCASYPEKLCKIISESNIKAVFCGHTHTAYEGMWCGKPYYTAPSFSFKGILDENGILSFSPSCGYTIYTINEEALCANVRYLL
ncbi:MAG: metallophosphoesterase [Clostridiales bacterium]|nr:metallophosphoesterase [Clostridiales bacterium]